jgi:hypothetical protein
MKIHTIRAGHSFPGQAASANKEVPEVGTEGARLAS